MLISEKTTESIQNFFASKEAYPIVRQLEKIMVKKAQAKVVKCAKNKSWVLRTPLGHLSVKFGSDSVRICLFVCLVFACLLTKLNHNIPRYRARLMKFTPF